MMKRSPGRPKKIQSPEEFDRRVDEYIANCVANEDKITLTGLVLSLGFTSRKAFYEYLKYDGYEESVRYAQLLIENNYETLVQGDRPTGPIFVMKNMGWHDTQRTELTGAEGGPVELSDTQRAARIAALVEVAKERKQALLLTDVSDLLG